MLPRPPNRKLYWIVAIAFLISNVSALKVDYQEKYLTTRLDKFNHEDHRTYQQRYLFNDQFWGKSKNTDYSSASCPGPILFYTGNESPVTDYWGASGFFTEVLAPKYGAMLVFAEHRYFGKSMPFGDNSFEIKNIGYCSTQQALADYAYLITHLKKQYNAEDCPVFAFGGSYGGMLTTFFRIKYPNLIMGGLAASAPFSFLGSGISPFAFTEAASNTYETARPGCGQNIKVALSDIEKYAATPDGRTKISKDFNLCKPISTQNEGIEVLNWAVGGLMGQAMLDYPYPTEYGISISGWPVNNTCDRIHNHKGDTVSALAYGIGTFYNYTGDKTCYNIHTDVPDWGKCCGWDYLACTEVYIPSASNGIFPYAPYDQAADIKACKEQFGVDLDPSLSETLWGGFDSLSQSSHIIFSNGLLDPWHTGGVLKNISDTLIAVVIPGMCFY
eukprot:TRINITY_DN2277_c0_g2_i3.p1 TRINITY_DN2277_c0_g2~~TRINITY_DN2277_c0_g2_i3.p1  ORF type:complete len:444 (-),score=69.82 TRINITY_DN2277_c0_g2_i3:165-1496(-)